MEHLEGLLREGGGCSRGRTGESREEEKRRGGEGGREKEDREMYITISSHPCKQHVHVCTCVSPVGMFEADSLRGDSGGVWILSDTLSVERVTHAH